MNLGEREKHTGHINTVRFPVEKPLFSSLLTMRVIAYNSTALKSNYFGPSNKLLFGDLLKASIMNSWYTHAVTLYKAPPPPHGRENY
jgi:hypothetical protein